jgi:hypothetical protein
MTTVRFDKVEYFWKPPPIFSFKEEAAKLSSVFPIHRYYKVRKYLRAYKVADDVPGKGVGWKVVRATDEIHRVFASTISNPGRDISIDEGMAAACSTKNPLYVTVNNKPLEGLRFFLAVCFVSKICIGVLPDLKQFPKESYQDHPGGFAGKIICTLLEMMKLPGVWYRFWMDNFYNSIPLTRYVLETFSYCLGGTIQKGRKPDLVNFGTAKKPKPSRAFPKGSLLMAYAIGLGVYVYGWMDSSAVFLIDSCLGPGYSKQIFRRNSQGEPVGYQVPEMIVDYNCFMGGVDVFDQIRKIFGIDTEHATKKYTVRMFEVLWSMILAQSYNVYRFVNRNRKSRQMNPTEFKIAVIIGLLSHDVVLDTVEPDVADNQHVLKETEPGSENAGSNRKKRRCCRLCPNSRRRGGNIVEPNRKTSYYCSKCKIFLHPQCFNKWHDQKGTSYVPSKQIEI